VLVTRTGRQNIQANLNAVLDNRILPWFAAVERGGTVANFIGREKQVQILRLLSEGNSIRSTERLTGIHRDTIMRTVVRFGNQCRAFLNESLSNLSLEHVQLDEQWTYCLMKEGRAKKRNLDTSEIGDQYLYTALDTDTKLLVTFRIGKRNSEVTDAFIADLEKRLVRVPDMLGEMRPQLSTDGWNAYVPSIRRHFHGTVRHGVLIKNYVNPEVGRYAPPDLIKADRINVNGIQDLATICTSHVERFNGSTRLFLKRFARLTYAFSKKLENLAAAAALHVAVYNFVRVHRTLGCTPAMAAGVIGELWDMGKLFDAVTDHANRQKRDAGLAKLIRKLQS
jgi:IS1 family transposase